MTPAHYRNLKVILDSGKYEVNTKSGHITSLVSNKQLKERINRENELVVTLLLYDEIFVYVVKHIVMVAAGYDITGKTVIHKDGNKLNNSLDNLKLK